MIGLVDLSRAYIIGVPACGSYYPRAMQLVGRGPDLT